KAARSDPSAPGDRRPAENVRAALHVDAARARAPDARAARDDGALAPAWPHHGASGSRAARERDRRAAMTMRVCFLCNEYPPGPHGGIGTCTQTLGRALTAAGHRVRVIGAYPPDHPGVPHEIDEGVEVWRLRDGVRRPGKALVRHRLFRTVARWARSGEIDLVEAP